MKNIWMGLLILLCLGSPLSSNASDFDSLRFDSVTIKVSDVPRSLKFYKELMGLTVLSETEERIEMQLSEGSQRLILLKIAAGEQPSIKYFSLYLDEADMDIWRPRLINDDSLELSLIGDGIADVRLHQGLRFFITSHAHTLNIAPQAAIANSAPLPIQSINHFTTFVPDSESLNQTFQRWFGLDILSYQGANMPTLDLGNHRDFFMFLDRRQIGLAVDAATIHHVSFALPEFEVDAILNHLKEFGLSPRPEGQRNAPPLTYYVSLRHPERGGAEGGTPEVYFTDPDGILLQLQHSSYCGGSGYLGNQCTLPAKFPQ